jgi:hypothetical protein
MFTGRDEQQVGKLSFATSVAVKMKMTSAISYRCRTRLKICDQAISFGEGSLSKVLVPRNHNDNTTAIRCCVPEYGVFPFFEMPIVTPKFQGGHYSHFSYPGYSSSTRSSLH